MIVILEEYGVAVLGAVGTAIIIGFMAFAFMNPAGLISELFSGFVSLYL
ncbi:MAG: hypothetical protein IJ679_02885 [Lachnospiraceae bacterium]|nr:hypothetical protein [Lachnospiraceae bacterium]